MGPDRLTLHAPAKINLWLRVTGRRADGYHTLDTLMQKVALYDRIELRRTGRTGQAVRLSCPDSALPEDGANLVHRAAALFLARVGGRIVGPGQGVDVVLFKSIPVAAGLGGGSSDAAAVLLGMNTLFQAGCSGRELADMGLALGADVPFFISSLVAARATGIGEVLAPAPPLAGYLVLLVNPGFSVSTKWAYESLALTAGEKDSSLHGSPVDNNGSTPPVSLSGQDSDRPVMVNDLEQVTACRHREIKEIKGLLLDSGAETAMMSGSGPTVFALFPEQEWERANRCLQRLRDRYPHVFLVEPLREKDRA